MEEAVLSPQQPIQQRTRGARERGLNTPGGRNSFANHLAQQTEAIVTALAQVSSSASGPSKATDEARAVLRAAAAAESAARPCPTPDELAELYTAHSTEVLGASAAESPTRANPQPYASTPPTSAELLELFEARVPPSSQEPPNGDEKIEGLRAPVRVASPQTPC